jgi:hypothetical protein
MGKEPDTYWIGDLVGLKTGLNTVARAGVYKPWGAPLVGAGLPMGRHEFFV